MALALMARTALTLAAPAPSPAAKFPTSSLMGGSPSRLRLRRRPLIICPRCLSLLRVRIVTVAAPVLLGSGSSSLLLTRHPPYVTRLSSSAPGFPSLASLPPCATVTVPTAPVSTYLALLFCSLLILRVAARASVEPWGGTKLHVQTAAQLGYTTLEVKRLPTVQTGSFLRA